MERKPHSIGTIVGAIVLVSVALSAIYVGGYFALGEYNTYGAGDITRNFAADWQAFAYWPLARLEAKVTGKQVWSNGPTEAYSCNGIVVYVKP